jgi:hypothetical protein
MWSRPEPGELCEELSSCLSYQGIPQWGWPEEWTPMVAPRGYPERGAEHACRLLLRNC